MTPNETASAIVDAVIEQFYKIGTGNLADLKARCIAIVEAKLAPVVMERPDGDGLWLVFMRNGDCNPYFVQDGKFYNNDFTEERTIGDMYACGCNRFVRVEIPTLPPMEKKT